MFRVGQKVVCKDTTGSYRTPYGIKKGEIYTVESLMNCPVCGEKAITLKEARSHSLKICSKCHVESVFPPNAFAEWRFEPLKYKIISNKHFIEEIVEERSDVPVLEPIGER